MCQEVKFWIDNYFSNYMSILYFLKEALSSCFFILCENIMLSTIPVTDTHMNYALAFVENWKQSFKSFDTSQHFRCTTFITCQSRSLYDMKIPEFRNWFLKETGRIFFGWHKYCYVSTDQLLMLRPVWNAPLLVLVTTQRGRWLFGVFVLYCSVLYSTVW